MNTLDCYKGCLLGGAAGDALGYPVEFMRSDEILQKYGTGGITEYSKRNGIAEISDDTQMTLFTAHGLLLGATRAAIRGIAGPPESYVRAAYEDWLATQCFRYKERNDMQKGTWLLNVPELYHTRAPGNTCISALASGKDGSVASPTNDSKGCGGVMRVAPVGLFGKKMGMNAEETAKLGAEVAALTHGHELGYIPAAALAFIVNRLVNDDKPDMKVIINQAVKAVGKLFSKCQHISEFTEIMNKAVRLAASNAKDVDAIQQIGKGWVAEETLAIAAYCAIKYQDNFERAIVTAVNHGGDSDSTGAVTGNIVGAYLGASAIPNKFKDSLEIRDVIEETAEDLFTGCDEELGYRKETPKDKVWIAKYVTHTYRQ